MSNGKTACGDKNSVASLKFVDGLGRLADDLGAYGSDVLV